MLLTAPQASSRSPCATCFGGRPLLKSKFTASCGSPVIAPVGSWYGCSPFLSDCVRHCPRNRGKIFRSHDKQRRGTKLCPDLNIPL